MYNYNFWIDESSFSPNKENKPSVPVIKVPFPPMVNPEELVTRQRKVKSKKVKSQIPTKPPNAFLIYRMQYIKELHNENYHLSMRVISSAIANSWRNEPDNVIEHYENIARQANKIFKQKFPKPPTHQKITVSHSHKKTVSCNSQQKSIYKNYPPQNFYQYYYIPQQLPNNSLGSAN